MFAFSIHRYIHFIGRSITLQGYFFCMGENLKRTQIPEFLNTVDSAGRARHGGTGPCRSCMGRTKLATCS